MLYLKVGTNIVEKHHGEIQFPMMGLLKKSIIQLCMKLWTIDLTGNRSVGHVKEVQLGHLPSKTWKLPAFGLCETEER